MLCKSLEMKKKKLFFLFCEKMIKEFGQKKFKCVWRRPMDASKHTNTFSAKCFIDFFFMLMKKNILCQYKMCYTIIF